MHDLATDLIKQVRETLNATSEMSDQDLKRYIETLVFDQAQAYALTANR